MPEIGFKPTGWNAVLLLIAILCLAVFQHYRLRTQVDRKAADAIRSHLYSTYAGRISGMLDRAREDGLWQAEDTENIISYGEALNAIDFTSLTARKSGNDVMVKAIFTLDSTPPPDGKSVRYFVMQPSLIGTWRVKWETTAWRYRLTLW